MSLTELRAALKNSDRVFVRVVYSQHDDIYLEVKKGSIATTFSGYPRNTEFIATFDGDNLYIG